MEGWKRVSERKRVGDREGMNGRVEEVKGENKGTKEGINGRVEEVKSENERTKEGMRVTIEEKVGVTGDGDGDWGSKRNKFKEER